MVKRYEARPIEPKDIKRMNRRNFLKQTGVTVANTALVGAAVGTAANYGLNYVASSVGEAMFGAEKEIRKLALDVEELSGSLEKRLATETKELKQHYTKGKLKIYEDLGIASPAELSEFEKIIRNSEEFEAHYNFAERARTFKDRLDIRLLSLDEKLESYEPGTLRKVNDSIRSFFGKTSGEEGKRSRTAIKERLEALCRIYDTNQDNRTAEVEVLKKINEYLEKTPDLTSEEKELLGFLKDQYKRGDRSQELKDFVKNYNSYSERNDSLLKLRQSLTDAEQLYGQIRQNKTYVTKLQDLLKQGIELKQEVRTKSAQEFKVYETQLNQRISSLTSTVEGIIKDLKVKGYDIETREDYANKGSFSTAAKKLMQPFIYLGTSAAALVSGGLVAYNGVKSLNSRKEKATRKQIVRRHNDLVSDYNSLLVESQDLTQTNQTLSEEKDDLRRQEDKYVLLCQDKSFVVKTLQAQIEKYKRQGNQTYSNGEGI